MLSFSDFCILAAFLSAVFSIRGYHLIATVLFVNFLLPKAAANIILPILDGDEAWPLHAVYAFMAGLTVLILRYLKASPPLYIIMFLFSVYNFVIVIEYPLYDHYGFTLGFHDNFIPIARGQMAIELLFMFLISKWSAYVWSMFKPNRKYNYFIDRFLSHSWRMGSKRLA